MMRYFCVLLLLSASFMCRYTVAQTSCASDMLGQSRYSDDRTGPAGDNAYYKLCASPYVSTCCARITQWVISVDDKNMPVELMIWRPTTGSSYELVYSQTVTPNDDTRYREDTVGNFLIQPNDCLGWHATGGEVLSHRHSDSLGKNAVYMTGLGSSVGDEVDWAAGTAETDGKSIWGIRLDVVPSTRPVFLPQASISKPETEPPGTLTTVTFTDVDIDDALTLTMATSPYFSFVDSNDKTGVVSISASLQPVNNQAVTLSFTARDKCGRSGTGSITVNVINTPPALFFLNASKTVDEDVKVETEIDTFVCNDTGGTVTASLAISPSNSPPNTLPFFEVRPTTGQEYAIYARSQTIAAQGQFNYTTTNNYVLTVICNDGIVSVTDTITVRLNQNQAPDISNLPANTSAPEKSKKGDVVFSLTHSDHENDDVFYSCVCDGVVPAQCPVVCHDSGQVQLTMNLVDATEKGYDIRVTIRDAKNTGVVKTLTLIISDINHAPRIPSLPSIISVNENKASGTFLLDVDFVDTNALDNHTFSMTNADGGNALFGIDPNTGVISTLAALDYETISPKSYVFVVALSDGQITVSATTTIFVNDVNEPLSFTSNTYRTNILERRPLNYVLSGTGITIGDPDANEIHKCYMDCGALSGYYIMATDCSIRVASTYTLDTGNTNLIVCTITATDKGNYTATTTLSITVGDNNDFTPTFSRTSYAFNVGPYDGVGTFVGNVSATDSDIGLNGTFHYTLDQSALNNTFFTIDSQGTITLRLAMSECNCSDTTLTIPVTATDSRGLSSTVNVVITVGSLTTTPEPTTTTDWYKTMLTDTDNLPWIVICILLLVVTLIAGVYICLKYVFMWKGRCCNFNRSKKWQPRDNGFDDHRPKGRVQRPPPTPVQCRQPPPGGHSWQQNGGR